MFKKLKQKLFGKGQTDSKNNAMSRLHFVLVQDRAGLTAAEMATFKSELMAVLEKYFIVDKQGFDVDYRRDADSTTLLINSPIVVRRQEMMGGNVGVEKSRSAKDKSGKNEKDKNSKELNEVVNEKATKDNNKEKEKKADAVASA